MNPQIKLYFASKTWTDLTVKVNGLTMIIHFNPGHSN